MAVCPPRNDLALAWLPDFCFGRVPRDVRVARFDTCRRPWFKIDYVGSNGM